MVYSATAAMRNASKVDTDSEEQLCGICHDPAEDLVVSSSFYFPFFILELART